MGAMQNEFVNLGDHHQAPDLVLEEWISEEFEDLDDAANDDFDDEGYVENDADIRLSIGKDKYDNKPLQVSIIGTTEGLFKFFNANRGTKKGETYICGPMQLMVHAKHPEKYPGQHFFRQKAGIRACKLVIFDFDGILNAGVAHLILTYLSLRYAGIWYHTASHTPERPRARACLILDRYVTAVEQLILSLVIQHDIELAVDAATLRQAHGEKALKFDDAVYLPYQPVYLPLKDAVLERLEGEPVAVDATLARATAAILTATKAPHATSQGDTSLPGDLHTLVDNLYGDMSHPATVHQLYEALNHLDPGMDRDSWRTVIFGLTDAQRRGVSDAYQWAHNWSRRCPEKYDARDLDRIWSDYDPNGGIHAESIFWLAKQQGWVPSEPAGTDDPEEVAREARARAGAIRSQLDRLSGAKLILPSDYYDHGEASRNIFAVIAKSHTLFNRGGVVVEWTS